MGGYSKCPVCGKMFPKSTMYRVHDLKNPKQEQHYCFGCACDAAQVGDYIVPTIVSIKAAQRRVRLRELNWKRRWAYQQPSFL